MSNDYKMTYDVDLVFCIDATGSMKGALNMVKSNALRFHGDLQRRMEEKSKMLNSLRIRIVAFRDYLHDKENAMLTTDFFRLPEDNAMFERAVKSIEPFGGGDDPEDGLEALAYAIRSKWNRDGSTKKRQIIVVWTDAPTHGLGYGAAAPNYPNGMPRSFEELSNWWAQEPEAQGAHMDYQAERLVLFAPDEPYWKTISDNWENVVHFPSIAGGGCGELDYNEIMETIVNSVVSNAGNQY